MMKKTGGRKSRWTVPLRKNKKNILVLLRTVYLYIGTIVFSYIIYVNNVYKYFPFCGLTKPQQGQTWLEYLLKLCFSWISSFFVFVNLPKKTASYSLPFMLKHRPSWKPANTTVVLKEQCHENKLIFKTSGGSFGFNNQP